MSDSMSNSMCDSMSNSMCDSMSNSMSDSGESVEVMEYSENELFEETLSYSIDLKGNKSSPVFTIGALDHRLFLASNNADVEPRHHDVVTDILQRKKEFLRKLKVKHKAIARRDLSSIFHNLEAQIEHTYEDTCMQIPSYIPRFTKLIDKDPDESFFGTYNWYYTGGCLQHVLINETHHLAYVGGRNRDNLFIAPVKCDSLWHVDASDIMNVTSNPGKEIFQVIGVESSQHNFIAIRQKRSCVVYCCENQAIKECFNVVYDIPFTSFDISPMNKEVCTISVNKELSFWDINYKKLPMTVYFPSSNPHQDKWHSLWYTADPSVVAVASRKSLKWMDRRSNNVNNSVELSSFKAIMNEEEISLHFASKQSSYLMYICTNVHLLLVDIRSPMSVIHRWPHHLTTPPLYSCVIPCIDDKEIAVIGNHSPGNVLLAFSSNSETYPLTEVPSRNDTLLTYQASGMCLDPSFKPRMMSSLTGLTSLKSEGFSNVELLTLTAASDIFSQALFDQSSDTNKNNLGRLASSAHSSKSFMATKRWNMTKLYNGLSNEDLKYSSDSSKIKKKQEWQLSKEELTEYKDVLSSIILAEWDVNKISCEGQLLSSEQKVNTWLELNNFEALNLSQIGDI